MKKLFILFLTVVFFVPKEMPAQNWFLQEETETTLKNVCEYFHSISINGGYVGGYSPDLEERYGEATYEEAAENEIWVQPPGTPTVGETFLRAYQITGEHQYLTYAVDAARALAWGQRKVGGWDHRVDVGHLQKNADRVTRKSGNCTMDDNITQGALSFLMDIDTVIERQWLKESIELGLDYLMESQFENGGWPQWYPLRGGYHDYYTFNDNTINDCIRVMMKAHKQYGNLEYLWTAKEGGNFIIRSQVPNPQAGWAQQYNHDLEPAWARDFEPAGVCGAATGRNIKTLVDLYLYTNDETYLQPIPYAIAWLKRSKIDDSTWARLYEVGTNKPIYGDRTIGDTIIYEYEEVSREERTNYGWQGSGGIPEAIAYYKKVVKPSSESDIAGENKLQSVNEYNKKLKTLKPKVKETIESLDEQNRWLTKRSTFHTEDKMIYSHIFVDNVNLMLDYLELLTKGSDAK